jgi:transcriptional regulator with XRE-family HTH domain
MMLKGADFIAGIRKRMERDVGKRPTDRAVAARLGMTVQSLSNWERRDDVTADQMAGLLLKVEAATTDRTQSGALRPIVEFFALEPAQIGSGENFCIFQAKVDGVEHPYLSGLRKELEVHHGVYIFHDSRGRALYAGKARSQSLWKEINLVFNRDRQLQNIRRVNHPERRQDFRTSDELRRQIRTANVRLHELAAYVSAYQVADGMIGNLESLLIRAFANDLLNKRMENFS